MTNADTELIEGLRGVQVKERQVVELLDSVIGAADEPESVNQLKRQKQEAAERERRLQQRLESYESHGSNGTAHSAERTGARGAAAHLPEHLEVSYALLERLARKAGDNATAKLARDHLAVGGGTAQRISESLDKIVASSRFDNLIT